MPLTAITVVFAAAALHIADAWALSRGWAISVDPDKITALSDLLWIVPNPALLLALLLGSPVVSIAVFYRLIRCVRCHPLVILLLLPQNFLLMAEAVGAAWADYPIFIDHLPRVMLWPTHLVALVQLALVAPRMSRHHSFAK